MARDTEEALKQLEAQLQEVENKKAEKNADLSIDDILNDEELNKLLAETDQGENPEVYENYSNQYGKDLRNYASNYQAYNADTRVVHIPEELLRQQEEPADEISPDEMLEKEENVSEEAEQIAPVSAAKRSGMILMLVILGLMTVVTGVIAWMLLMI